MNKDKLSFIKSLGRTEIGQPKPSKEELPKKGKGSYKRKQGKKVDE